ncbi:hypothetical protein FQA47_002250 [Oryzias melastigma]|uniref:Uncharacterized protein n=1 Tax=Oryzias melastigma TaxID=30732 RepID=A0A834CIM6_ORYME|nr:hypothetical protein FQA47_002250 [Oryzias melastigma]
MTHKTEDSLVWSERQINGETQAKANGEEEEEGGEREKRDGNGALMGDKEVRGGGARRNRQELLGVLEAGSGEAGPLTSTQRPMTGRTKEEYQRPRLDF